MHQILDDLGPLYHEYSFFGVENKQLEGNFIANQKSKSPIIIAYIAYAIAKSKKDADDKVSFMELFCADGYYAMVAKKLGANKSYCVDNDKDGYFKNAKKIADRLKIDNIEFLKEDVENISKFPKVDIVANIGGLYHVSNPKEVIEGSYNLANKYLIIQSVVSLANRSDSYFEAPAPGWSWGCRFSKESFTKTIRTLGYRIVDMHFNELEGNERLEDRGSIYFLIKKD